MTTPEPKSRINEITEELKSVINYQYELAKAELRPNVKRAAFGGGLFGAALTFALHALWMLLIAGALTVGWLLNTFTGLGTWSAFIWGFVLVAVVSLILAAVCALIGRSRFKQIRKPEATIDELNTTIKALTAALKREPQVLSITVKPAEPAE
ncbi:MAG: phage holin family protein [Propionibacteriaceae bacterium]|nr:phage holin family protein [Propionibacteriaceae bacterium]